MVNLGGKSPSSMTNYLEGRLLILSSISFEEPDDQCQVDVVVLYMMDFVERMLARKGLWKEMSLARSFITSYGLWHRMRSSSMLSTTFGFMNIGSKLIVVPWCLSWTSSMLVRNLLCTVTWCTPKCSSIEWANYLY